jgi:GT2 family glycosyltransferase
MPDQNLKASVIICAYTQDRWSELVAAVESLYNQNTPPGEIIVVIDHNPYLYQMALSQFPDILVMENRGLRGLSAARNTGTEMTSMPIIAFMDEDATAHPEWLTRLLEIYQDKNVIGVGGRVEPDWLGKRPVWFPDEFAWVIGCTYIGLPKTREPVRNLLGCNMSFRREVFESSGGFRDNLGRLGSLNLLSCEETEFCIRVNRKFHNSRFMYEPLARVYHKVPSSRATWHYYRIRCYAEGFSKAMVANYVGTDDGLASERSYTWRVLPYGILRNIRESVFQRRVDGLLRAVAITAGLVITTLGYLRGRMTAHPENVKTTLSKASKKVG